MTDEARQAARITPAMGGRPMAVIAAQLGNGEAMRAQHCAHMSPGYVAETVRAAFGSMGIVSSTNVAPTAAAFRLHCRKSGGRHVAFEHPAVLRRLIRDRHSDLLAAPMLQ